MFYEEVMFNEFEKQGEDYIESFKKRYNIKDNTYKVFVNLWIDKGVDIGVSNGLSKDYALSLGRMFALFFTNSSLKSDDNLNLDESKIRSVILDEFVHLKVDYPSLEELDKARMLCKFIIGLYLYKIEDFKRD